MRGKCHQSMVDICPVRPHKAYKPKLQQMENFDKYINCRLEFGMVSYFSEEKRIPRFWMADDVHGFPLAIDVDVVYQLKSRVE